MVQKDASAERLAELMVAYQGGDLAAFDALFAELSVPLRNYLASLARDLARGEDLMQETFLQMHRSRQTYMPGRPVKALGVWYRAPRLLDVATTAMRRSRHETNPREELPEMPVAALAELFPAHDGLGQALALVSENRREALLLHHIWGFTFREIGDMLGITERAAKLRAFRGIQTLRGGSGSGHAQPGTERERMRDAHAHARRGVAG